jgi:phage antirepressor YoqD-like protein
MVAGLMPIREAAKELEVTPRQLLKWVLNNRIFAELELDGQYSFHIGTFSS